MTDEEEFLKQKILEIEMQKRSLVLQEASKNWMQESIKTNYSYHFEWLGRPIIQYPQDMIAVQQLLWRIQTIADLIDRVVTNIDNESIITEVGNEVEKMMQDRPLFTWE